MRQHAHRLILWPGVAALIAASGCGNTRPEPIEPGEVTGAMVFAQGIDLLQSSEVLADRFRPIYLALPEHAGLTGARGASPEAMSLDTARARLARIVADLHEPHAKFIPASPPPGKSPPPPEPVTSAPQTPAVNSHPPIPTRPTGQSLSGGMGYLLLPGCPSTRDDDARAYAAELRCAIRDLRLQNQPLAGLIIDLRLNGGGNVWPMLLGLQPLLGDGPAGTALVSGEARMTMGCSGDGAWLDYTNPPDRQERLRIDAVDGDEPYPPVPVAVLVHQWTMSSGELIAGMLRTRPRTRLFGEGTAGLTTGTFTAVLGDGSVLTIPTHEGGDRNGKPLGARIMPDQFVPCADWPSPDDAVATAARAWILQPN